MKKRIFLLLEITIWFLLLTGLVSLGIVKIYSKLYERTKYNFVFKDVDNLLPGSPVRLMGIHIGHVVKIEPLYDKVYVTFVTENKNIKMPEHAIANIQFTGLAGSKSLEILPLQTKNKEDSKIIIIEPVRAGSVFEIQNSITKSIVDYCKNFLKAMGDNSPDELKEKIKDVLIISENMATNTDNLSASIDAPKNRILEKGENTGEFIEKGINKIEQTNETVKYLPTKESLQKINYLSSKSQKTFDSKKLEDIDNKIIKVNSLAENSKKSEKSQNVNCLREFTADINDIA